MADARRRRRSALFGLKLFITCVCIFVGDVCAPEFCVWKILCVVNVVKGGVGGEMYFFFLVLKLKT